MRPTLHSFSLLLPEHLATVETQLMEISGSRRAQAPEAPPSPTSIEIPLTAVSIRSSFDAFIDINFKGSDAPVHMIVDSGNSTLIVPRFEDIQALPNFATDYRILVSDPDLREPWGCPVNVVSGPIEIPTTSGTPLVLQDCVFYACTADNPDPSAWQSRTANFGAGCLSPWSANGWNTPAGLLIPMQAPLSYATSYPYVEFNYEAASNIFASDFSLNISTGSSLLLHSDMPDGYTMLDIIPGLEWMSLIPKSLAIGGVPTGWPGTGGQTPIAMIDTGGGPVFLSDPLGYVYDKSWNDETANPPWADSSINCQSIYDSLSIELTDRGGNFYSYSIPALLPGLRQEWTLVMCQVNHYMMGRAGMNIGGISALVNSILIDHLNLQIGMKSKAAAPVG